MTRLRIILMSLCVVLGCGIVVFTQSTLNSPSFPNGVYLAGVDQNAVARALIGMNSSGKVNIDPDARGSVISGALTVTGAITTTGAQIPSGGENAIVNGHPIFYADTGIPLAGTNGTNTTGIAHQLWYTQIFIPQNFTITNAAVLCGGTCGTDKIAIGIWSTAGTLLAFTGANDAAAGTALSGANTWQTIALTTPYAALGPSHYIIGVVTSGTNAGDIQTAPLLGGVCAVASSQGTLANFTPVTTTTTNSCPFAYVN